MTNEDILRIIEESEQDCQEVFKTIDKQQKQIEEKSKKYVDLCFEAGKIKADLDIAERVIDKMAEKINQAYFDEGKMYIWFEKNIIPNDLGLQNIGIRKQRIKEYFYKEIENE